MSKLFKYCNLDKIRDYVIIESVIKNFPILFILNRLKLANLHFKVTNWVNPNLESNITRVYIYIYIYI